MKFVICLIGLCILVGRAKGNPTHFESSIIAFAEQLPLSQSANEHTEATKHGPTHLDFKTLLSRYEGLLDTKKSRKFFDTFTNDPDIIIIVRYFDEGRGKEILNHIWNEPEYENLVEWFHANGITDIYWELDFIQRLLKLNEPVTTSRPPVPADAALAIILQKYFDELMAVLPIDKFIFETMELYEAEDPTAVALLKRFREPGMVEAWARLKALPATREFRQALIDGGVALELFIVIVETFFGYI